MNANHDAEHLNMSITPQKLFITDDLASPFGGFTINE